MSYTRKELAEASRLSERLVAFYSERGVLSPEVDPGEGRGKVRRYSDRNLAESCIVQHLAEFGVTVSRVLGIMSKVRERMLFKSWFSKEGDLVRTIHTEQRLLVVVSDMNQVELKLVGSKVGKIEVDIVGHENILIIDVSRAMRP